MQTLNLGILAHVDAGKTSLTERLLFAAGALDEIGRVDRGTTQTDSLALERQRGITIRSAVVSFELDGVAVNLLDTPGHPDFIAEVERVLDVLDGAVLVISAVEGVQPQTRLLMRTLRRLRIPTLVFVNKIDRRGARYESLLRDLSDKLDLDLVALGKVAAIGTAEARFLPFDANNTEFRGQLVEVLSLHDEALLGRWVDDIGSVSYHELRTGLRDQTQAARVAPVVFGSAITGAGVAELMATVAELLPTSEAESDGLLSGSVFKVDRGAAGEKVAYVRMFSGTLRTRDRLLLRGRENKVTGLRVFDRGQDRAAHAVTAGRIAKVWGLDDVRIADSIGLARTAAGHHFAPPTLETVVMAANHEDKGALRVALAQLAEQDPLIDVRQDDARQEIWVCLYGEVQKEVIGATLASDYGVEVSFRESSTICVERPAGRGHALEVLAVPPNPFLATIGLRVEPTKADSGVEFGYEIELGALPRAFLTAIEESVRGSLQQGLYGWRVTDCRVVLTHSGYAPRQSHAHATFDKSMSSTGSDFRGLTPLVLMSALAEAGTTVLEPLHAYRLELPGDCYATVLPVLAQLRAAPHSSTLVGASLVLEGRLPAAEVHRLRQRLPGLTSGQGELETVFHSYTPVRGRPPRRARSDHNPLDRKAYLLAVERRVALGG